MAILMSSKLQGLSPQCCGCKTSSFISVCGLAIFTLCNNLGIYGPSLAYD